MTSQSQTITNSKELIIISLTKFFGNKHYLSTFLNHVTQTTEPKESKVKTTSLRVIDWFVTNYAKKNAVNIHVDTHRHINVYINYRSQLKAYSKHQFDPFRRRFRINYYYDENTFVETTIGQLNFFKWLIENKILDYITEHQAEIEADMMASSQKKSPDEADGGTTSDASMEGKAASISNNAVTSIHNHVNHTQGNRIVMFG